MKSRLLIATDNAGKLKEFQSFLSRSFECISPRDPTLQRLAPLEVDETGLTYFENALTKALGYARTFGLPVLADDSGLEIDALKGAPGVYSARFGGAELSWPARWEYLYQALGPFPRGDWTARFRSILCYYDGQTVPYFFSGRAEGHISPEPKGGQGFGYDPVFFSLLLQKTFGEASDSEKEASSHRAEALRHFLHWWKNRA